jgi:hypothetical protein
VEHVAQARTLLLPCHARGVLADRLAYQASLPAAFGVGRRGQPLAPRERTADSLLPFDKEQSVQRRVEPRSVAV